MLLLKNGKLFYQKNIEKIPSNCMRSFRTEYFKTWYCMVSDTYYLKIDNLDQGFPTFSMS